MDEDNEYEKADTEYRRSINIAPRFDVVTAQLKRKSVFFLCVLAPHF